MSKFRRSKTDSDRSSLETVVEWNYCRISKTMSEEVGMTKAENRESGRRLLTMRDEMRWDGWLNWAATNKPTAQQATKCCSFFSGLVPLERRVSGEIKLDTEKEWRNDIAIGYVCGLGACNSEIPSFPSRLDSHFVLFSDYTSAQTVSLDRIQTKQPVSFFTSPVLLSQFPPIFPSHTTAQTFSTRPNTMRSVSHLLRLYSCYANKGLEKLEIS